MSFSADPAFPFIDFETHVVDPKRFDRDLVDYFKQADLFEPYHPELLRKYCERLNIRPTYLEAYCSRENEFPGMHMIVNSLVPQQESLMGRLMAKSKFPNNRNVSIADLPTKFSHPILKQYEYMDCDMKSARVSLFSNFVLKSSKYSQYDKEAIQDFMENRDEVFESVREVLHMRAFRSGELREVTTDDVKQILTRGVNGMDLFKAINMTRFGKKRTTKFNPKTNSWFYDVEEDENDKVIMKSNDAIRASTDPKFLNFVSVCELLQRVNANIQKANETRAKEFFDVERKLAKTAEKKNGKDFDQDEELGKSLYNAVYFAMETHVVTAIMGYTSQYFDNSTCIYTKDGFMVQLFDNVQPDEFMEAVNKKAQEYGVEFKAKPFKEVDEEIENDLQISDEAVATIFRPDCSEEEMGTIMDDFRGRFPVVAEQEAEEAEKEDAPPKKKAKRGGKQASKKRQSNDEIVEGSPASKGGILVMNDLDAAMCIYRLYRHWVYCNGSLYVFDKTSGMWSSSRAVHDKVIISLDAHLYVSSYNHDGKFVKNKTKSYGNTECLRNRVYSSLNTLCQNDKWHEQTQHSSLGKILFNNGYYDSTINGGQFVPGFNPDIVFFAKIHHDYEPLTAEDEVYMQDIKQRYFENPLGNVQAEFLLENLACAVIGTLMKRYLIGLGGTNCGKSVITKALKYSFGEYVGAFNAENLAVRSTCEDEAKAMRWCLLLRHKRLILSNEMTTKNVVLNGNMIKKLSSGGDDLVGRTHGQEETSFVPTFLPVCFANDLPKINPYDDAVDGRVCVLNFKKTFVDNPQGNYELKKDPNVEKEMLTLRFQRTFVQLLLHTHRAFLIKHPDGEVNQEDVPLEVRAAKTAWVAESVDPVEKFLEDFEITNDTNDYVESKSIEEFVINAKLGISYMKFIILLKKYLEKMEFANVTSVQKKISKKTKNVWLGVKELVEVKAPSSSAFASTFNL